MSIIPQELSNDEFFERQLLIGMITSTEFLEKVLPILDISLFESPEIALVVRWCQGHFKKYQNAPGRDIMLIYMEHLKAEEMSKVTAQYLEEMLTSISDEYEQQAEFDINYLLDKTNKYFQTRKLTQMLEEAQYKLKRGKLEQAEEIIKGLSLVKGPLLGGPETMKGSELMEAEIIEPRWVVPGLMPVGLTILAGKAKLGKSFLVLGMAVALAQGGKVLGKIKVAPVEVIYLALEDPLWRIKNRLAEMEVDKEEIERLHIATSWQKGQKGIADLDKWLGDHPNTKAVFIDVLERFRSPEKKPEQIYRGDYRDIAQIKNLSNKHNVAIVLVHHTRKATSSDDLDLVLGSTGLTGGADTVLVMKRRRGENNALLSITGRDIEERELGLARSYKYGWKLEDKDYREFDQTPERQELVEIIRKHAGPVQLKTLADEAGKTVFNVRKQLKALVEEGIAQQPKYGEYTVAPKLVPCDGIFRGKVLRAAKKELEQKKGEGKLKN